MTFALLFAGLAGRAPVLLGILFARSLPFVLYATVTPRLSRLSRFAVPVAFAAVAAFAARTDRGVAATLLGVPFAAAYFAAGALLVHRLAASLPPLWIRRGAVLLGGAGLFVLGPAAVVRHAVAVPMIVFGWEMMLSAHSYAVDTKCAGVPGSLRDCLFFLLVRKYRK